MHVPENSCVIFSGVVFCCPKQILFFLLMDNTGMYMYFLLGLYEYFYIRLGSGYPLEYI